MRRLKRCRSSRAIAFLLLLLAVSGAPHKQQDDAACLPQLTAQAGDSRHAVTPVDDADRDHCAICHWVRSLKPAFSASFSGAVASFAGGDIAASLTIVPSALSTDDISVRGPPTPLL